MRAEEFAASVGFDALRISMGGKPRLHDVDTICRWLRHASTFASADASDAPDTPTQTQPSPDRPSDAGRGGEVTL